MRHPLSSAVGPWARSAAGQGSTQKHEPHVLTGPRVGPQSRQTRIERRNQSRLRIRVRRFDSSRGHLQPHGYTKTAWLRGSCVPGMPEMLAACLPRCLPRKSSAAPRLTPLRETPCSRDERDVELTCANGPRQRPTLAPASSSAPSSPGWLGQKGLSVLGRALEMPGNR